MSDLAIKVENLGKLYRIGQREPFRTLRDTIIDAFTVPLSWLKKDSSLSAPCSKLQSHNGYIWALKDLSFEVKRGEVVGIIGRNGAGKSTLLKILSRITEPTEGQAEIYGRVGSLLEVGTGFHAELTGRENVYLNGAILGMKKAEIEKKFDEIVDFAEIEKFIDTPVKHYSSGMHVRLAFAVAAHLEPEILLVDEVLAVGDMSFQRKCLGKMHDVSKFGRTIIFVSHNLGAVTALCGHTICLDSGRIVFEGSAEEAVRYYLQYNLTGKSMVWELAGVRRSKETLGKRVLIEKVEVVAARPEGFLFGEELHFRLKITTASEISNLECALGIDDIYGSRVITFESDGYHPSVDTEAGTRYTIELKVRPFGLLPGNYLLSVSLYSGIQFLDYLIHFGTFTINPISAGADLFVVPKQGRGSIHSDSEWLILKGAETCADGSKANSKKMAGS